MNYTHFDYPIKTNPLKTTIPIRFNPKLAITQIARMRRFARMQQRMRIHGRSLCERLAARTARIRPLPRVLPLMNQQPMSFGKRFFTLVALMEFYRFMVLLVIDKQLLVRKETGTALALVNFGLMLGLRDCIASVRFAMHTRFIQRPRGCFT